MTAFRMIPVQAPATPKSPPGQVVLLHAVGQRQADNNELVDLSLRLVREALGPKPVVTIHANDAGAFADHGSVVQAPGLSGSIIDKVSGITRVAAGLSGERNEFKGGFPELDKAEPSLIIGVGGGYLRAGTRLESVKTAISHLPQVLWAGNQPVPSIYLPQSIGPLASRSGRRLRDAVERIDHLFVRDDRTASLFRHHDGLRRAPDLELMDLVDRLPANARDTGHSRLYLAAGRLPRNPRQMRAYASRIQQLRALLPDVEIILDGDNGDDAAGERFYRSLGWQGPYRTVPEVLAEGPSGVMISVGLDNCLQAMTTGWPTVHLATERKGFGAFADLSLESCVRKATCFEPQAVANIAASLRFGRIPFWSQVAKARDACAETRAEMVSLIAMTYRQGLNRRRALA